MSLDGDRSDYLRAIRKAAEDDDICGMFFVSTPDFEFANFTLVELEEILWLAATEMGTDTDMRSLLHQSIAATKSSGEMFAAIRATLPELDQFGKGEEWGKRLMSFAWERPEMQDERTRETKTRPIVEAINYAIHSVRADYYSSRANLKVDPATGKPIERSE